MKTLTEFWFLIPGLIFIFLVSLSMTIIYRKWAISKHIFDIPNERSAHLQPVPRGGGIAVVLSWYIIVFFLFFSHYFPQSLFIALLFGIPVALIGMIDDLWTISPYLRLLVQFLCATLAIFFLRGLLHIDLGFTILEPSLILNIAAILGTVWFINLFNFLDGIDGYISAEIMFICLSAFILTGSVLPLFLSAATAGFLLRNWQPAKIFMGDVGSTLLGFTIAVFSIFFQNTCHSSVIIWLMLTSLFWFDASVTLLRRIINGEKISEAHKKHAYQRIVQSGFSHQQTVLSAIFINCVIFILTFLATIFPKYLLILFLLNILFLFIVLKIVDRRFPFKK